MWAIGFLWCFETCLLCCDCSRFRIGYLRYLFTTFLMLVLLVVLGVCGGVHVLGFSVREDW